MVPVPSSGNIYAPSVQISSQTQQRSTLQRASSYPNHKEQKPSQTTWQTIDSAKLPGPNGLVGEIYKHAPYILRMYLLDHFNVCFAQSPVPESWLFSEVVMIVKNYSKDTTSLANYRPISLTNVSYKIFASMIQSRLAFSLDSRIRPTQLGFRKNCSTTQPIHILRRLLEVHERQPSPFHALFWD